MGQDEFNEQLSKLKTHIEMIMEDIPEFLKCNIYVADLGILDENKHAALICFYMNNGTFYNTPLDTSILLSMYGLHHGKDIRKSDFLSLIDRDMVKIANLVLGKIRRHHSTQHTIPSNMVQVKHSKLAMEAWKAYVEVLMEEPKVPHHYLFNEPSFVLHSVI